MCFLPKPNDDKFKPCPPSMEVTTAKFCTLDVLQALLRTSLEWARAVNLHLTTSRDVALHGVVHTGRPGMRLLLDKLSPQLTRLDLKLLVINDTTPAEAVWFADFGNQDERTSDDHTHN
jgi:hypothetical protein